MRPKTAEVLQELQRNLEMRRQKLEEKRLKLSELRSEEMVQRTAFAQELGVPARGQLAELAPFLASEAQRLGISTPNLESHVVSVLREAAALKSDISGLRSDIEKSDQQQMEYSLINANSVQLSIKKANTARTEFAAVQEEFLRAQSRVLLLECELRELQTLQRPPQPLQK